MIDKANQPPKSNFAVVFADGGSRGNPGPAGAGAIIKRGTADGEIVAEVSEFIGRETNNVAEYSALILGLKKALELGFTEIEARMDSELVVKQMKGEYKVKNETLEGYYMEAIFLAGKFKRFNIVHVPRAQNKEADKLANAAMDQAQKRS
jgi:Ribonuclease HI